MTGNNLDVPALEQGPKRRSFPGTKDGTKAIQEDVQLTANSGQVPLATPFKSKQSPWYSRVVKREGPLIGLLATGTAMVILNQVIADQVQTAFAHKIILT